MHRSDDFRDLFVSIHHSLTDELLILMEGLFANLEAGLFEIANRDPMQKAHCVVVAREMEAKRNTLIRQFASAMQSKVEGWFEHDAADDSQLNLMAREMSQKSWAHYSPLLTFITERTMRALETNIVAINVPIGPYHIARAFMESCQALSFEQHHAKIVGELFKHHVLDHLGAAYAKCNQMLKDAGVATQEVSASRATLTSDDPRLVLAV